MVDLVLQDRVTTTDPAVASSALAEVLGTGMLTASGQFRYEQRSLVDSGISVTRLACESGSTAVRTDGSPDLIVVAVGSGQLQLACRDTVTTVVAQGLVLIPFNEPYSLQWTRVAANLYSFPLSSFVRTLGPLNGAFTIRAPFLTSPSEDLSGLWRRLAELVTRQVLDRSEVYSHDVVRTQLIDGLTAVTVEAFGLTNQQEDDQRRDEEVIRRANEFIRTQLSTPNTVAGIAAAATVSVRSLQLAYQRRLGSTPIAQLRRTRLEAARVALSNPGPDTTVGEVARRMGYSNLGRFSAHYRDEYDETPSATLTRARPRRWISR